MKRKQENLEFFKEFLITMAVVAFCGFLILGVLGTMHNAYGAVQASAKITTGCPEFAANVITLQKFGAMPIVELKSTNSVFQLWLAEKKPRGWGVYEILPMPDLHGKFQMCLRASGQGWMLVNVE